MGNKFYIILRGTVSILVPGQKGMVKKKETMDGEIEEDEFYYWSTEVKNKIASLIEFIALGKFMKYLQ